MKTKKSSHRAGNLALAILLPTLGAALPAHAAEHVATFESTLDGWTAIKDTAIFDWARRAGGTPSSYTGPSRAHGGEYYLYLETSYGNTPGKVAYLESRNFEDTVSSITFHYHMYGYHMGTLALEAFDGGVWRPVWRITGQQHAGHASAWTQKRIDLSGRTVEKIRFKGTTGAGYRGDMAIDQVTVTTGEATEPPTTTSPWSKSGRNIYYADSDGGNVGIGDNAPTADLSVLGNLSRALTGHVMASAGSTRVIGAETLFTEELRVGDSLLIGDAVFVVTGIQSDTALTVDTAPTVSTHNATAYTDSDLLIVETGAEKTALVVDRTGNVGIGAATPKAKLEVAGGIKIGNETVCDAGKAGTIRYDDAGKAVEFCDGSGWSRAGLQGEQGPRGLKGDKGEPGATGARGLRGERGPTGTTGPQGLRGLAGAMGPRGLKGDKGDKGDTGETGPQGKQGLKGDKGDPGIIKPVVNLKPLNQAPANPTNGDLYFNSSGALCVCIDGSWKKVEGNGYCTAVVYFNDFSAGAGTEWTNPTTSKANGESFLAAASHGSGRGTNSLTLSGLPTHTKVTVEFDLYIINSWDGNDGGGVGPDNWRLTVDGNQNLLYTSFATHNPRTQAYPSQLPPFGNGASNPYGTGSTERGHLGSGGYGDWTYRLSFTFNHSASNISLNFTSLQNQAPGDEGWGLDNVKVSLD